MPLVYQQNINVSTRLGVWHITEAEEYFLDTIELRREIKHPNKRLQHLAGRHLLRELYPDFPLNEVQLAVTRKPFLQNEAYHFSISHSGVYAAVIISTAFRVGVDVELISGKVLNISHKYLSEGEEQLLQQIPLFPWSVFNEKILTAAWSIKESLYKWQASGEIDFKKHLVIDDIKITDNEGVAHCTILKNGKTALVVHFLFFGHNCLSWVLAMPEACEVQEEFIHA